MVRCTMGIARIASLPPWTRSKAVGKALLYCLTSDAFVGLDHELACIWTSVCVMMVLKLYYFCYYIWTWVVITHFVLRCMLNYSWTFVSCGLYVESCTILVVCWIIRDPAWYSTDYRIYMDSSMTVRSIRWLPLYLCSYKLVSSATAGIGARFNIIDQLGFHSIPNHLMHYLKAKSI